MPIDRSLAALGLAFALLTPTAALNAQQTTADDDAVRSATATITAADARARVAVLADDALRGRATPGPGLDSALAYVSAEFRRLRLQPAGDDGGWLQHYPLTAYRLRTDGLRLVVRGRGVDRSLRYGSEFAIPTSVVESMDGELVYLGAVGDVVVPVDRLDGRVAVFFVGGPLNRQWNGRAVNAMRMATTAGAAGAVLVLDPQIDSAALARVARSFEGWRMRPEQIAAPLVAWSAAAPLFEAAGLDPDALRATAVGDEAPAPLGVTVRLDQPVEIDESRPANALALLPGSDPALRDEIVLVTAHVDHVGVGRPDATGDSIYNGADDNASGTAGMLEIAEAFAALPRAPRRTVLFAALSGEERGLLGARWLAAHVPGTGRVVADINLDMISRNAPDTLAVAGHELSTLGPLVDQIAAAHPELGLAVVENVSPQLPILHMSDQAAFLDRGVPALFFNSGDHPDLHRPSDQVETIDVDKTARAARLAFLVTHAIAADPAAPTLSGAGHQWLEEAAGGGD